MTHARLDRAKAFFKALSSGFGAREAAHEAGLDAAEARDILKSVADGLSSAAAGIPPKLVIYVDGASRGNPGKAGAGALIKDAETGEIRKLKKNLGVATNNVAEYSALVMALHEAKKLGAAKVTVFADSELMVKQLNGEYRVKSEGLMELYAEALSLKNKFREFSIVHVERAKNAEADRLANEAIDGKGH